jgi:TM2 domain-containing membrane protein YozV
MKIDTAKKKLADGRLTLANAGDNRDLLGVALVKIHGALEDACRSWLSVPEVSQIHQLNISDRHWKDLAKLMFDYYQWTSEDLKYVCRIDSWCDRIARAQEFQGNKQEIESYAIYVENWLNQERKPFLDRFLQDRRSSFANATSVPNIPREKPIDRPHPQKLPEQPNIILAYVLWGLGLFGFAGIHRFYLGKPVTGTMWLFSYGCLFVGQLLDLFLIPSMASGTTDRFWRNLRQQGFFPISAIAFIEDVLRKLDRLDRQVPQTFLREKTDTNAMHKILKAAAENNKVLSIGQAMMATGLTPQEVEELFNEALRRGLAHVGNDPESGAVRYYFDI